MKIGRPTLYLNALINEATKKLGASLYDFSYQLRYESCSRDEALLKLNTAMRELEELKSEILELCDELRGDN